MKNKSKVKMKSCTTRTTVRLLTQDTKDVVTEANA